MSRGTLDGHGRRAAFRSVAALGELHGRVERLGFNLPEHFLFPWHGPHKHLDLTRPMSSWRSAWRSVRTAARLSRVRFHDGRHTALTRLAEKGVPDWVIRAHSLVTCRRQ